MGKLIRFRPRQGASTPSVKKPAEVTDARNGGPSLLDWLKSLPLQKGARLRVKYPPKKP